MSGKRPPAPPPAIAGYEYVSLLGTGGFSDVYLYQQDRPRRKVAVKVLLSDLKTEGARRRFESEANLMAQLSSHPYIVTIFEANVTGEGHSYLAMEYCSRPSLDVRYRRARLGVDEVLSIGIQVASAVETAHRAGIVHRDIKPANILVTDYNRPALTDFGISGTTDTLDDEAGLSIPWSPPEAFDGGAPEGVRMDVWSLGATIYTLLAGRSPFVRTGADNSQRELISRIANSPLQPLNRADVPSALEQTLATAMSKDPAGRFASAHQLALSLQRVQAELGLPVTPFEVLDDAGFAEERGSDDDGDATRLRQVVSIDPRGNTGSATGEGGPPQSDADAWDHTLMRTPAVDEGSTTERAATGRAATQPGWVPAVPTDVGRPRETVSGQRFPTGLVAGIASVAAVVMAGALVANTVLDGAESDAGSGGPQPTRGPSDPLAGTEGTVAPATGFETAVAGETVRFTWENADPHDGDVYFWAPVTATDQGENRKTKATGVETPRAEGQPTCIQVTVVRSTGRASEPARHCAAG